MSLCSICLRTNLAVNSVSYTLVSFYDNLLDHQMFPNLFVCATCKQLLERCYNFKQLCLRSNRILRDWKNKKEPGSLIENLHSLIEPYYDKVLKTIDDERKPKTESEDISIIIVTNNDKNSIANNDDEIEKLNNEKVFQINDVLKGSIELSHFGETDLNLSDDECNGIDDNIDNGLNGIGDNSDNECNGIENKIEIQNKIKTDYSENNYGTDDDSIEALEIINKLLNDAKKKTEEINKQKQEMKKKTGKRQSLPQQKDLESYGSVFNIVMYNSLEEAKADFMERPNSDYYKNATVKCTICYTVFKYQKSLDYHMKWHDPSAGDIVCDICKMRYKTLKSLRNHLYYAHQGSYSCKKCPLFTNYWKTMLEHYKTHQGILYKCKHCDVTSRHHQTYLAHLRNFHPSIYHQRNNVCTICGHTFASPNGLRMHRSKSHKLISEMVTESSVRCEECDLTFANEEAYNVHVMKTPSHKDVAVAIIACSACGQRFDNEKSLVEHKREIGPFAKCLVGMTYNTDKKIQNRENSKGSSKGVTCEEGGATGINDAWLYRHCKRNHPNLPYKITPKKEHLCDICGKSFHLKGFLVEHMREHTGERPFACAECGKTFASKLKLNQHSERHKPPSRLCTVCGKKFVSCSNLANHMRIHIGDRRYKCSHCGKGFLSTTGLHEHVRGVHLHLRRVQKQRRQQKEQAKED